MKTEMLEMRVQPNEKEAFRLAARESGLGLSTWARERLRRAARIELEEAGLPNPIVSELSEEKC